MIGDREIIFRRVSIKAFDRTVRLTDYKNMVDCFFKRMIVILGDISPREAIMISNAFFRVFNGNIVRMAITVFQKKLDGLGLVIGI